MISPVQAVRDFSNWTRLGQDKLIVNIAVYADESGTHDLSARQPGSKVAVLAGYFGYVEDWLKFCDDWQSKLNEYRIPFFHFSEYSNKSVYTRDRGSPYFGWDDKRRHDFLYGLAQIASGNRVRLPFATSFNLSDFHSDKYAKPWLRTIGLTDAQINGPYLVYACIFYDFFEDFLSELRIYRPYFNGSIKFVFDRKTEDILWQLAAGQMFNLFANRDSRLKAITFADKREDLPLQAADMFAYRAHQIWENMHKQKTHQKWSKLDYTLWGFTCYEEFRQHYRHIFGKELRQIKTSE